MANDNQENDVSQPSGPPAPVPAATDAGLDARGASRRRFARAGAGVTGVLLTLASNPGMACSVNVGPSGYQSAVMAAKKGMKVSHAPNKYSAGLPPRVWARGAGWPCKDTQFNKVFSCFNVDSRIRDSSLMAHCAGRTGATGDKAKIAMLLSAAHLNVLAGRSPFLSLPVLQNIWNEFQRSGAYAPMAGVPKWNAADIVTYLSGTMD